MPVFINIIFCILTILAFILCFYYSLFRKTSLSKELESIVTACESCTTTDLPQQFTLFLAQRKLNYWGKVVKEIVGPSMLISLMINIVQWGNSLKASAGWSEVKQFVENPGIVFYANFLFICYVALTVFLIDQTISSFSSAKKEALSNVQQKN